MWFAIYPIDGQDRLLISLDKLTVKSIGLYLTMELKFCNILISDTRYIIVYKSFKCGCRVEVAIQISSFCVHNSVCTCRPYCVEFSSFSKWHTFIGLYLLKLEGGSINIKKIDCGCKEQTNRAIC